MWDAEGWWCWWRSGGVEKTYTTKVYVVIPVCSGDLLVLVVSKSKTLLSLLSLSSTPLFLFSKELENDATNATTTAGTVLNRLILKDRFVVVLVRPTPPLRHQRHLTRA